MSDTRSVSNQWAAAASLIAAPVLVLGSALVQPALKSDERAQLGVIQAHHDRYFLFTALILFGTMLLVPAFHALRSASLATRIGSAMAVFGALVGTGDAMTQFVFLEMASPGRDLDQMAKVVQSFDQATGPAQIFMVGGLALVVGVVTLAVGLYRERLAPVWVSALLALGMVVNMAGFIVQSAPALILSSAMLLVSMAALGLGLLNRPATDGDPVLERALITHP